MLYNNTTCPELVMVMCDGDAVLIPRGFHPNVSDGRGQAIMR